MTSVVSTSESVQLCLTHSFLQIPENATFLTDAERTWLLETLRRDNAGGTEQFKPEFILQALREPKAYAFMAMFFL